MKPEYPLQISNLVAKTAATDKKKKSQNWQTEF